MHGCIQEVVINAQAETSDEWHSRGLALGLAVLNILVHNMESGIKPSERLQKLQKVFR